MKNKPFWELGLNPITMDRHISLANMKANEHSFENIMKKKQIWNKKYTKNELSTKTRI